MTTTIVIVLVALCLLAPLLGVDSRRRNERDERRPSAGSYRAL
jgi:hypothetical protein